jgi:hypothetical protein
MDMDIPFAFMTRVRRHGDRWLFKRWDSLPEEASKALSRHSPDDRVSEHYTKHARQHHSYDLIATSSTKKPDELPQPCMTEKEHCEG